MRKTLLLVSLFVVNVSLVASAWSASSPSSLSGSYNGLIKNVAAIRAAYAFGPEDQLLDLSKDNDPSIRKAAVRGMRNHMHHSRIKDRVEELLRSGSETVEVRLEAVKNMSVFLNDWSANSKLMDLARSYNDDVRVRAMAMKALYHSAALDYSVRGYLTDVARGFGESNQTLRAAAIWGLMNATQNDYSTRERLIDIMRSSSEPAQLRVEALKSLYQAMNDYSTKDKIKDIAKSSHDSAQLRYGAILALSAAVHEYDVRGLLEDLARRDTDLSVRRAATLALGDPSNPEILSYFHIGYRRGPNGAYVDPLDAE